MLALADLYSRGSGVKPNLAMVQIWHEQAARVGNIEGMFLLGQDLSGKSGRPADYNRARIWFEQAASAGHGEAMRALGDLYRNGQGVDVSMIEALMWYRLAVKAGSVDAKTGETLLSRILPAAQQSDADGRAREWEVLTGRAPSAPVQQTAIEVKKTSDNRNDLKAFLPLATASLK
jgi:TPR repeat protein